MEFAFLTSPEVEGAAIRWNDDALKPHELVAAAIAAGFSEWEILESAIGILERELIVGGDWTFKAGARVLIGMNGCTLVEVL